VIKLHGDYLDARIKNTDAELSSYAEPIDQLLDEVFDRFGLVVAGWSGEWDTALRAAILRAPNRRYALYWAARSEPTGLARDIVAQRGGRVVPIKDADSFFGRLSAALDALRSVDRPHPQSVTMAVALAKKFCRDDAYALEWSELLAAEVEKIRDFVNGPDYQPLQSSDPEAMTELVRKVVACTEILRRVILVAGRWGTVQSMQAVARALSLLGSWPPLGGITLWLNLRSFAGTLCFYWGLVGTLARDDYQATRMLTRTSTSVGERESRWRKTKLRQNALPSQKIGAGSHLMRGLALCGSTNIAGAAGSGGVVIDAGHQCPTVDFNNSEAVHNFGFIFCRQAVQP
jgi:hypothetical protein